MNNQNNFNNQFNGMNNQNNFNNQFNGMNNQTNFNNQFNGMNNQNNNSMSQVSGPKKKVDIKTIAIIAGVVLVVVFFGSKLLGNKQLDNNNDNSNMGATGNSIFGTNKNTTGSTEYKDSDVDLNCTYQTSNEKTDKKLYTDVIFNYKYTNSAGTEVVYQVKMYNKLVMEYKNGLTDSDYQDYVLEMNSANCLFADECTDNHLDLGISSLGTDTVVDRIGNKIETTYEQVIGTGITATEEDMKTLEKQLKDQGMICN